MKKVAGATRSHFVTVRDYSVKSCVAVKPHNYLHQPGVVIMAVSCCFAGHFSHGLKLEPRASCC